MEKLKEFLQEVYGVTVEEIKINQLEDAINYTDDMYRLTGDDEYIVLNCELQDILEVKLEEMDNEVILQLERQVR